MAENQARVACVHKWIPIPSTAIEVATDLMQFVAQKATGAVGRRVRRTIESIPKRCLIVLLSPIERSMAQRFVFV